MAASAVGHISGCYVGTASRDDVEGRGLLSPGRFVCENTWDVSFYPGTQTATKENEDVHPPGNETSRTEKRSSFPPWRHTPQ